MDTAGFWNLPKINDPENEMEFYKNSLANYNRIETSRAQLEGRKPRLRKPSIKQRAGSWADARRTQIQGELDRRKWQGVVDRMRPLIEEASNLMSALVREIDGPPPAKVQKQGFAAIIAWKAELQNQLRACQIEYERLSQQWASHQGLLREARKASGFDQRQAMEAKAQEKLSAAAVLADDAQEQLGLVVDFAAEAEEAFKALEA